MSTDTSVPHPRVSGVEGQPMDASDAALYATLLKEAPGGLAFFDGDLRCRRANDALAALLGVAVRDLQQRRPAEALPAEVATAFEAALRKVLDEDRPISDLDLVVPAVQPPAPARPADPPGDAAALATAVEERILACTWLPARSGDGEALGVVLTALDVTERRRAEEVIRRKEQRYRSLVEASAQVVWVAAPGGGVIDDAPEWRAITGQTPDDYAAGGWLAVVHPEDRPRIEATWRECVAENRVFETNYRVRTKSGTFRHFDVRAVPIWQGGAVIEWVGANTDVTGQREAEEMRGRLTEQLSAAALRTARLQQATSMLAEALTVSQVVQVITEVGRSAIGADYSAVALLDDDKLRLSIVAPSQPGAEGEVRPIVRDDIKVSDPTVMSVAVRESRPFLAEHPDSLRLQLGRDEKGLFTQHTEERAWVGLPLLAAGAPIGALRFSFTRPREITEEERVFLEALAGQCALAVERALLFEREHKTAEELQRSLLPSDLPQLPGMVLAARYNPATRHVQVGGDWYDVFRLPDDRLAVAVGDVMGKGVLAAAGMGRVRNALRALALNDPRPAAVLAGLDRLFSATEDEEQFTTVAYVVIDPETGHGAFSNAGHPPPLLISPDTPARVSALEPGTPLGWPSQRQQTNFSIETSNTVVFYSDGLVENRRRGVDAGLEELVAVAADAPPEVVGDPERLVDFLVDRMLAGYEQVDDVTVLALHVPPKPA
ncbi:MULTISPECIES: SpoIIE family protein phosphatase [Actinomadura]|uniref:SpoIIE family protein phosphatase n=1 Tax=Actinomadura litoris TaxID=2678616 RepID=A0A7K1KVE5_9ACTN|nr:MULTISPECIES: SpoIIE family protein phosphatase [Actinomadura]MBT2211002.1 SpoIIE family protein phosphatase [Actinomadura sp. NEAU-AAG7]MUN35926.1 SpoIIE family protein phosphatase [Actinomadura litoris]